MAENAGLKTQAPWQSVEVECFSRPGRLEPVQVVRRKARSARRRKLPTGGLGRMLRCSTRRSLSELWHPCRTRTRCHIIGGIRPGCWCPHAAAHRTSMDNSWYAVSVFRRGFISNSACWHLSYTCACRVLPEHAARRKTHVRAPAFARPVVIAPGACGVAAPRAMGEHAEAGPPSGMDGAGIAADIPRPFGVQRMIAVVRPHSYALGGSRPSQGQ